MGLPSTAPRPDLIQPGIDELAREVEDLKRRVSALEARAIGEAGVAEAAPAPVLPALNIEAPAGAVVLLGKGLLGLAGAYLLRALTDASILPRGLGLAAGLAYAAIWLYLAARSLPERRFAAVLDVCISTAIVGPLLWEATVRLQAISRATAAGILVAFAAAGLALSWRKRSPLVARIAVSAAAAIAMTLLVASGDLLPFTVALLALAALVEFAACRDFRITERWLVAALADLAVVLFAYIVTRKGGTPEGYVPLTWQAALALQACLAAIYVASTVVLTFGRSTALGVPQIVQAAAALLVGLAGAIQIGTANVVAGMIALAAGAGSYILSLVLSSRTGRRDPNYFAYEILGFALLVAGAWLALPGLALVAACSMFAVVSCWKRLYLHGAAYLWIASALSGVALESFRALFGVSAAGYGISYIVAITGAGLCYFMVVRGASGIDSRIAAPVIAADLIWLPAGMAAHVAIGVAPAIAPTSRTAVLMALSLTLAWAGIRWKRAELVWLVYGLMALGAYKLLTQDFSQEQTLPLVVSLLLYGSTLMALPRVLRPSASGTANDRSRADASNASR